jgi:ADP-ribose pyrophosphatase YjhB (NUDIX family)
MTYEAKIHEVQTLILRDLLFVKSARFADVQKNSGLDSDHFKFHIGRLVEIGYVDKTQKGEYMLTIIGKEYANKLDTDAGVIERQPKVVVMLVIEREASGTKEYLLQQRRKHPYYGFWGAPTGKVRWGESIIDAASRELKEETGLNGKFEHRGIFHERVMHDTNGEIVEDKIFHIMLCQKASGELIDDFEGGHNEWRSFDDMKNEKNTYKSFYQEMEIGIKGISYVELLHSYGENEF